jgi:hypothetical protein
VRLRHGPLRALYLRPSGSIACRSRPRFARNHSLRVHHCDRTGATDSYPVAEARKALLLPLGAELDATIHRRRRELGLSTKEMQVLLGWKGRNNLHRYKYKPNVMPRTLYSVLDRLFDNEGGWVEAGPLWSLVRKPPGALGHDRRRDGRPSRERRSALDRQGHGPADPAQPVRSSPSLCPRVGVDQAGESS